MTELHIDIEKEINAPITKVFDAWLNAETLSKFMLPMPGMPNPKTENDPRPGGSFAIHMQVGNDVIPHTGEYLQIDRPNKLVFTWISPFSTDGSTVTLLFSEVGDNKTLIKLNHIKFPNEESRNDHEGGWGNILESLSNAV